MKKKIVISAIVILLATTALIHLDKPGMPTEGRLALGFFLLGLGCFAVMVLQKNPTQARSDENECPANVLLGIVSSAIAGGLTNTHEPDCTCAHCQKQRWEEAGKIGVGIVFTNNDPPVATAFLEHHDKIARLIRLREVVETIQADTAVFKRIVENHEDSGSVIDKLSTHGQQWLNDRATATLKVIKSGGAEDAEEIIGGIKGFVALLAGTRTHENPALNEVLKKARESAIKDASTKFQKEIDRLLTEIPRKYHDATKAPTVSVPAGEIADAFYCYNMTKHGPT